MYFAFNLADVPDDTLIPAGWYPARIVRSDLRDLKSGDGQRLVLTYALHGGPYTERRVEAGFNVDHPNPQAVEISQKELAKVLRACGLGAIQDTLELHDRLHQIRVGVETYKDRDQNRITDWRPMSPVAVPSAAAPAPASAPAPAPNPTQAARQAASQAFQAPPPPAAPPAPRPARSVAPPAAPFPTPAAAPAESAAPQNGIPFNDDIPW